MKILFVADARSPIAQNWMRHFAARRDEIYIASTFAPPAGLDFAIGGLETIPVAFSALKKADQRPGSGSFGRLRSLGRLGTALGSARALSLRTAIRQWLGPLTVRGGARRLRGFIDHVQPDLIHAMRIPYEGMISAVALSGMGRYRDGAPLIVSSWGNDFTLHAPSTRLMRHYTRRTMQVADALHADCQRDLRLAGEWGFSPEKPGLVIPGNGGVRSDIFYPPARPVEEPVVINPRGFRPYVRNDTFFKAIPLVLARRPDTKFVFASMADRVEAAQWVQELKIGGAVELLPLLPHRQMAEVFRRAQIVASPSVHDGTPNTLLEGMACGCFPIAGDLESIREWITPGENGLLFDAAEPESIAAAILTAIDNRDLRKRAAGFNREIIAERAEYQQNMRRAEEFYEAVKAIA
ncbi:MAG TPA: glycosyltransferase [Anaerolineales bacterium]|nr:glycosyltransferase [Anaerolineales bacterium]